MNGPVDAEGNLKEERTSQIMLQACTMVHWYDGTWVVQILAFGFGVWGVVFGLRVVVVLLYCV